jgi:hypothetical protein
MTIGPGTGRGRPDRRGSRPAFAVWLPLAAASVCALIVGAALRHDVPDVIDRPIVQSPGGGPIAVPLPFASTDGRESNRELVFRVRDVAELERYDEIRLVFGTFETSPSLQYGWLHVAGRACSFQASSMRLGQNAGVVFRRAGTCGSGPAGPADATLRLSVEGPARYARAAVWTVAPAPGSTSLLAVTALGQTLGVAGRTVTFRGRPGVPRIRLLAFMWDVRLRHLIAGLLTALILVMAGAVLIAQTSGAWSSALSAFAFATGLALCYAAVVPPLQAPDEPDHLLSFAKLTGRPALAEATSAWARRIHFYRVTFMAGERFTPADREQPFALDWPDDVFAENVAHRSSTTTRMWQALAPLVPERPAHALLLFRCADAIVFGAAFALGAALLSSAPTVALPGLLALILLTVPTLPFFGMQMSELTLTIVAFVVAGHGAVLLLGGAPGRVTGPLLGVAVALIAAGPRSGWPSLVVVAALAAGRLLSAAADRTRPPADTFWFWSGLAAPSLVLFGTRLLWIPSPFYEQWHLTSFDPRAGLSSAAFLLVVSGGACCGALGEWLLRLAVTVLRTLAPIARACAVLGALAIAATLVWSAWAPLPMLTTVESVPPESAFGYVQSVLVTLGTWARVRGFDFLTWTSLWGGFGWLNAILPEPTISIVTVLAAAAAIVTLIAAARPADGRQALILVCGVAGLAASAAAAALSSYGLHRNIHGRYLLGGCLIGLCLLVAPAVLAPARRVSATGRAIALLALCGGLHAFSLIFLLERYFG